MSEPTQTALIVPVPAAEPVVAEHRLRHDPAALWGVPAHVTVLYPFVAPASLDGDVVARVGNAVRSVPAFGCRFDRCAWFDQDVLWLAPDPAEPFRGLTTAVWRAFPDHPPYGGAHPDLAPHLTVGQRTSDADPAVLRSVESVVEARLPVTAYVAQVHLVAGSTEPGSWRTVHVLELAGG